MSTGTKETVIGPETRIAGEIRGEEDLVVRGRIDGRIDLEQTLTVEAGGIVRADVQVKNLVVSGVMVGNIVASDSVRLTPKARVVGDVTAPRFVMEAGAAYRGRVEMGEGAEARAKERRAAAERPVSRQAPPRSAPAATPRLASATTTATMRGPAAPSAPPRVASAPARTPAPSFPRPEASGHAAAAPAWAKKKLRRR